MPRRSPHACARSSPQEPCNSVSMRSKKRPPIRYSASRLVRHSKYFSPAVTHATLLPSSCPGDLLRDSLRQGRYACCALLPHRQSGLDPLLLRALLARSTCSCLHGIRSMRMASSPAALNPTVLDQPHSRRASRHAHRRALQQEELSRSRRHIEARQQMNDAMIREAKTVRLHRLSVRLREHSAISIATASPRWSKRSAEALHKAGLQLTIATVPNAPGYPGKGGFAKWIYTDWRGAYDHRGARQIRRPASA